MLPRLRISTQFRDRHANQPAVDESVEILDDAGSWPRNLIVRQYPESPQSMKKFQMFLAENAGQDFSSTEIAEAIGAKYGSNTIAGQLRAYGRRVKNRYKRSASRSSRRGTTRMARCVTR